MSANVPVYNHRPMQPSSLRTNSAQGPPPAFSLDGSFDAIRHGYESIQSELNSVRNERDELENKLESQVVELSAIRRSLFELESSQAQVRLQYEDEINRLRSELMAVRMGGATQGIPGRSPQGAGISNPSPSFPSDPQQQQQQQRDSIRPPNRDRFPSDREKSLSNLEREPRGKVGSRDDPPPESERERSIGRLSDRRDPKRHKARGDVLATDSYQHPMGPYPPPGSGQLAVKPLSNQPTFSNTLGLFRMTAGPSGSSSTLPPMNFAPPDTEELTIQNVPPDCRKEGNDWCAIYNPKVKKALDVNLVHTFNHATVVCCVQFSADGRRVATGCNRTAQIFDVQTGKKLCTVEDETAPQLGDLYIRSVRFSPDGKLLATGAEDRKIRVWDIDARRILHVFDGHQQEIYSLDFSRDGRYIVSGSGDKTMRIWDMSDQSCRTIVISDADSLNDDAGVTSVAISPDGRLVAAGSLDTIVRIWDVVTGVLLERLKGHDDSVYSVAFTPDGKGILSGSLDKTLRFWDISTLVNNFAVRIKQDPATTGLSTSTSTLADVPTTSPLMTFVGHKDFVLSVSVSNDNRWVVSGSKDRTVHFWDSRNGALQFILQGHKNSVISLDINPLGGMLATGSGDSTARIWTYSAI